MRLNLLFSAAILALLVVIDIYSLEYPFEARLFPWVIGIPATILMAVVVLKENFRRRPAAREDALRPKSAGRHESLRAHVEIIAWMAGFLAMIYLAGFLAGIPLFVFLYLKTNRMTWGRSLALAVEFFIIIYGVFYLGMKMRLFPGWIYTAFLK